MVDKRVLLLIVAMLVVGVGASLLKRAGDKPKVSFTEGDLQGLEEKLNELNIEDLEGLGSASSTTFTEEELEELGAKIDGLSFDDLEEFSSP